MKKVLAMVALCVCVVGIMLLIVFDFGVDPYSSSNNNYLVNIEAVDELDIIDTGTIYFGSDYCPTCVEFKPILEEFCNANNSTVYYFDLGYLLDNKILDEAAFDTILNKYQIEKIPTLINVKDFELNAMTTFGHVSSDNTQSISNQIKEFIYADDTETKSFFTQNNIELLTIILMLMTIISVFLIFAFIYRTKTEKYTYLFFCFHLASVCSVFVLRHLLINGADKYYWSINSASTIVLFTTFSIDLIAIVLLIVFRKQYKHK